MQKSVKSCPAEDLLKSLSGKLKPQIFQAALEGSLRFNSLLREIEGANKQSLAIALKELVEEGYLEKAVISQKPLHIEYRLSERGEALIPVFQQLERLQ